MLLGLATVGTSAAYADADDINYDEAVDVMTAIGVLAGDESGFRPADTLKRSEGAKIVAYLMLGNTAAESISGTGAKFTDVPANHWAAGYIEYLTSVGVLGGVGGGKFDPDGALTTNAFAKMLLCALGYDQQLEGLVGNDWAINTQKLATQLSLFKGNSAAVGSTAVTREEAALYALNTIKSPLVQYADKGTTVTIGDASVVTGASNWTYMTTTSSDNQYTNIDNARVNGTGAQIVEFAEQYYGKLKLAKAGTDAFNRPANVWTLAGKEVGTYAKAADLQYTAAVKMGKIYTDLGLTSGIAAANMNVYEDGVIANNTNANGGAADHAKWTGYDIAKGSTNEIGGKGALTEVYYDEDNNTADIFVMNTYFTKLAAAYAATSTKDAYVALGGYPGNNTGAGTTYETEDFKADDYVLYTYSYKDGGSVESMQYADAVQGTLNAYQEGSSVTIDGTKIDSNTATVSKRSIGSDLQNAIDTTVTVFKDKYGYAVCVDATAAKDAYAVVLGWTNANAVGDNSRNVTLLFLDGTKKTVANNNAAADFQGNNNITTGKINTGDIVSYRVNSKGEYKLTLVADAVERSHSEKLTVKGNATLGDTTGADAGFTANIGTYTGANGKTIFVLYNQTSGTYTVYNGIANVPSVTAPTLASGNTIRAAAYSDTSTTTAKYVFIQVDTAAVNNLSRDVIFIKGGSGGSRYDTANGSYYQYDAIVNDEITTIKTDDKVADYVLVTNLGKDSDDIYDYPATYVGRTVSVAGVIDTTGSGTKAANSDAPVYYGVGIGGSITNDVVTIGGATHTVASDAKFFRIAMDGTITAQNASTVQEDGNDKVWYKITDGDITTMVIKTEDGLAPIAANGTTTTLAQANYSTDAEFLTAVKNALNSYDNVVLSGNTTLPSGSLLIAANKTLTVNGNLYNEANPVTVRGTLTVNGNLSDNGHFDVYGKVTITGTSNTITSNSIHVYEGGSVAFTAAAPQVDVTGKLEVEGALTIGSGAGAAELTLAGGAYVIVADTANVKVNGNLSVASSVKDVEISAPVAVSGTASGQANVEASGKGSIVEGAAAAKTAAANSLAEAYRANLDTYKAANEAYKTAQSAVLKAESAAVTEAKAAAETAKTKAATSMANAYTYGVDVSHNTGKTTTETEAYTTAVNTDVADYKAKVDALTAAIEAAGTDSNTDATKLKGAKECKLGEDSGGYATYGVAEDSKYTAAVNLLNVYAAYYDKPVSDASYTTAFDTAYKALKQDTTDYKADIEAMNSISAIYAASFDTAATKQHTTDLKAAAANILASNGSLASTVKITKVAVTLNSTLTDDDAETEGISATYLGYQVVSDAVTFTYQTGMDAYTVVFDVTLTVKSGNAAEQTRTVQVVYKDAKMTLTPATITDLVAENGESSKSITLNKAASATATAERSIGDGA